MIKKIKSVLKKLLPYQKIKKVLKVEKKVHKTVPAPTKLPPDPWFGSPVKGPSCSLDNNPILVHNKEVKETPLQPGESPTIHQEMYEVATKNWTSVEESQGGSENLQKGPGEWSSGTGYNQFRP